MRQALTVTTSVSRPKFDVSGGPDGADSSKRAPFAAVGPRGEVDGSAPEPPKGRDSFVARVKESFEFLI